MNIQIEKRIANSRKVVDFFGCWPKFCEALIRSIGYRIDKKRNVPIIVMEISAFDWTENEPEDRNLSKQCLFGIQFIDIAENLLEGFSCNNTLLGLNFGVVGDLFYFEVEAQNGIEGYIEAREIEIVNFEIL